MYTLIRMVQGFLVFAILVCLFVPALFPIGLRLAVVMVVLIAAEGQSAKSRLRGLTPVAAALERRFIAAENAEKDWVAVSVSEVITELAANGNTAPIEPCRQAMEAAMLKGDRVLVDPGDDPHGFKIKFDLPRRPVLRQRPDA